MHANTALPCVWALGAVLALTGCASRGHSTTHPLDLPVAPSVVASAHRPALRTPSPPSVLLLSPGHRAAAERAVPLAREEHVQPALKAPALRAVTQPAPCALTPELTSRRPLPRVSSSAYDVPALADRARQRQHAELDTDPCAGGT